MTPRCFLAFFFLLVFRLAFAEPEVSVSPIDEKIQKMSLHEKVGQVFLVGFPQSKLEPSLKKFIQEQRPGGFILFRRNLKSSESVRKFTRELKELADVQGFQPFLAIDQEGGSVTRIPYSPSLPSALAVGLTGKPELAASLGEESGHILRWHGFNLNLAPVLDLADDKSSSFIGSRSFGSDPTLSGTMGFHYAKGLGEAGIIATAKHFPGLGSTQTDLHVAAAGFKSTLEEFKAKDLKPFQQFAGLGPFSAVMVSQMSYPFLDPSGVPAPFSKVILTTLLREELGFQGLVLTDDLQMKGSTVAFSARDAALESLKAGADIVMISWSAKDQKEAMARVEEAIKANEWPLAELEARVKRILTQKQRMFDLSESLPPPALKKGFGGLPSTERLEQIDLELLDAKLSPFRRVAETEAAAPTTQKLCVLTSESTFLRSFRQTYRGPIRPLLMTNRSHSKRFIDSLKNCPLLVFTVSGKKSAQILGSFDRELRQKTMIVNFNAANLVPNDNPWALRIELGHHHQRTGQRIAEIAKGYLLGRKIASVRGPRKIKKPRPEKERGTIDKSNL